MTEEDNKTKIGQISETDLEDYNAEVDLGLDKILREEISEEEAEKILGTTTDLTGVGEGQETGLFHETLGEMIEVAVVQDQVKGQVPIETRLNISDAENMITLLRISQT